MAQHRKVAALVKEAFGVRDVVQKRLTAGRPGYLIGRALEEPKDKQRHNAGRLPKAARTYD